MKGGIRMNCNKALELMSLYLDNELDKNMAQEFLKHIEACPSCKKEFEIMHSVVNELREIPLEELPDNFHDELISKIEVLNTNKKGNKIFKFKKPIVFPYKKYVSAAAVFIFLIISGSLGVSLISNNANKDFSAKSIGSTQESASTADNGTTPQIMQSRIADEALPTEDSLDLQENNLTSDTTSTEGYENKIGISERKIIKNLYINLNVDSFDTAFSEIKSLADQNGGYIENYYSDIYYINDKPIKQGNITLRMPEEKYDIIKTNLSALGVVENENENTEDVTSQYIDTQGKLKMKKIEEERLLELLKKAETVDDILKIEAQLSTIRTDIEIYTSSIQNWDKLIKYSTITINLNETDNSNINSLTPDLQSKIKQSFIKSINSIISFSENTLIFCAQYAVPSAIIIIFLLFILYFLRFIIKKHRK